MRTVTEFDGNTDAAPKTVEPSPDFLIGDLMTSLRHALTTRATAKFSGISTPCSMIKYRSDAKSVSIATFDEWEKTRDAVGLNHRFCLISWGFGHGHTLVRAVAAGDAPATVPPTDR